MTSVSFFDTAEQADESTRVSSSWLREQKLETALPNPPKITRGASSSTRRASSSRPNSLQLVRGTEKARACGPSCVLPGDQGEQVMMPPNHSILPM